MAAFPSTRPAPGAGATRLLVPLGLVLAALLAATAGGSSARGVVQLLEGPQAPPHATGSAVRDAAAIVAVELPAPADPAPPAR